MFQVGLYLAIGVDSGPGGRWSKPGHINIQVDDHRLSANRSNASHLCRDLRIACRTIPQLNVHRGYRISTIPNLTTRIDEFGVGPIGFTVSRAILAVPSLSEGASKLLCRFSHFK